MKKTKVLGIILVIALPVFLFYSCSQDNDEAMSIPDRIDKFVRDVNNSPGNVWTNCHPSAGMTNEAKPAVFWTTKFGSGFSLSSRTVTATVTGGLYIGQTITFTMLEDGANNWKIRTIYVTGAGTIFN